MSGVVLAFAELADLALAEGNIAAAERYIGMAYALGEVVQVSAGFESVATAQSSAEPEMA